MSNVAPPKETAPAESSSPVTLILRVVLIAILGLLIAAIFIDRQSGEESQKKYDEVLQLSSSQAFEKKMPTQSDVEATIKFPPAGPPKEYGKKGDKVYEEYHWKRGLPMMSNVVYVIYTKGKDENGKDKLALSTAHYNLLPAEDDTTDLETPPQTPTPSTGDTPPTPPGDRPPPMAPPGPPPSGRGDPASMPPTAPEGEKKDTSDKKE